MPGNNEGDEECAVDVWLFAVEGSVGLRSWLTVGAHSAFLAAFLLVPASTARSLGDPDGELALD
ncbi:hypothetical protein Stsp01_43910 [Streptomyces sp. NBRC 13847]|nr:hypothetical protein Stsp01_43910 [Streptomyces sp. NBRC 13847]